MPRRWQWALEAVGVAPEAVAPEATLEAFGGRLEAVLDGLRCRPRRQSQGGARGACVRNVVRLTPDPDPEPQNLNPEP
jgi:hypothetical protein